MHRNIPVDLGQYMDIYFSVPAALKPQSALSILSKKKLPCPFIIKIRVGGVLWFMAESTAWDFRKQRWHSQLKQELTGFLADKQVFFCTFSILKTKD